MKKIFLCLSLAVLLFTVGCEKERTTLQLNLKQGALYTRRVTTEQKVSQTVRGQRLDMEQTMILEYGYDVTKVDDMGNATVRITYTNIGFTQDSPMGRIDYKSWEDTDSTPTAAKAFAAMPGKSFTIVLSPQGRITRIVGSESMLEDIIKAYDMPMDDNTRKQIVASLKKQFGEEALKETMNNMFAIYPDRPVGIGDSWSAKIAVTTGFPVIFHHTWKLKRIEDGKVYIEMNSKIEPNTAARVTQMGMEMTYDVRGEQKGTLVLDESSGWLSEADIKQMFKGNIVISSGRSGQKETMEYPIAMSGTSTIETIER